MLTRDDLARVAYRHHLGLGQAEREEEVQRCGYKFPKP